VDCAGYKLRQVHDKHFGLPVNLIIGGKFRSAKEIVSHFPASFREYREPFGGSLGVCGWLWRTTRRSKMKFWVNDIDPWIYGQYRAMKDNPEQIIQDWTALLEHVNYDVVRARRTFDKLKWDLETPVNYMYVSRLSFGEYIRLTRCGRARFTPMKMKNLKSMPPVRVAGACHQLQYCRITGVDYSVLLDEPGEDVFCYLDPPYLLNPDIFRKNGDHYNIGFTWDDHELFWERVIACKHKVLVSYGADDYAREMLVKCGVGNYFYGEERCCYYTAYSSRAKLKQNESGMELLLKNY